MNQFDENYFQSIEIYNITIRDLSPLNRFNQAHNLAFQTKSLTGLHLEQFTHLRRFGLVSPTKWSSYEVIPLSVTELLIDTYKDDNLERISHLKNLKALDLTIPKLTSIKEIQSLSHLEILKLYRNKVLDDFTPISVLENLRLLEIHTVPSLNNIDFLKHLKLMSNINIEKCGIIDSVAPLGDLTKVTSLAIVSTKVTDHDLGPLLKLTKLRDFRMKSEKPYSPSVAEIRSFHPQLM